MTRVGLTWTLAALVSFLAFALSEIPPAHAVPSAWGSVYLGFQPVTHTHASGSGTETIPCGARQVIIEAAGPGASGGGGDSMASDTGGGGGSGGVVKKTFTGIASNCGQTFSYTVGTAGASVSGNVDGNSGTASTVTNATFSTSTNLSAGGGVKGLSFLHGGTAGAGGTATGGDVNTNGNAGSGAAGGSAVSGTFMTSGAGGGGLITGGIAGGAGTGITFVYS